MWYCKDCGEYFELPQWLSIGIEDIRVCPYCESDNIKAIDIDNDWRKYINE